MSNVISLPVVARRTETPLGVQFDDLIRRLVAVYGADATVSLLKREIIKIDTVAFVASE